MSLTVSPTLRASPAQLQALGHRTPPPAETGSPDFQGDPGWTQLQARALRVLAESPPGLVEPLVSIFRLRDAGQGPLLAHIHHLHQEGKFKEVSVSSPPRGPFLGRG